MSSTVIVRNLKTSFGELILGSLDDRLCLCDWLYRKKREQIDARIQNVLGCEYKPGSSEVIARAVLQINEYFAGKRKEFSIPLLTAGTPFQKKVWEALKNVQYGTTMTYKELASKTGRPDAVRAAASASGANAISVFIPCHRIIGSGGELTGYAGGIQAKKRLLELESDALVQMSFGF